METEREERRPRVAVILAAGRGSRLLPFTEEIPKCLLDVGGESILGTQLRAFERAGIDEVIVLTGFQADLVDAACAQHPGARTVENVLFASTNSLHSLSLAAEAVAERAFVLTNGDVLFHPEILTRLLASEWPSALTLDSSKGRDEEEMKVETAAGKVVAISKRLPLDRSHGESLGLLRFSACGARELFLAARRLVQDEGLVGEWAPRAYNEVIVNEPIGVVEVAGLPWIEIDTPEDLERARSAIYPACVN
jgi:choline kinase